MIADTDLYRAGGVSGVIAIVALIISGITIALFFGGAGAFWGPVNDVFVVVTALALILPMLAIDRWAGEQSVAWMRIVTIGGLAGAVLIAIGQTLLVVGVISLQGSFVTGGVGFVPVFIWLVSLIVLAFGNATIPTTIGWAAVAVIGFIVVDVLVSTATTGPLLWIMSVGLLLALTVWLWTLSAALLSRAGT